MFYSDSNKKLDELFLEIEEVYSRQGEKLSELTSDQKIMIILTKAVIEVGQQLTIAQRKGFS